MLATLPFLVACVAGGLEILLTFRWREAALGLAWVLAWWSAFVTFAMAVLPDLRYDYAPEIRAGATTRLWLFLSRVIRPDPDVVFPSLLRIERADVLIAAVWVVLAAGLTVVGILVTRQRPTGAFQVLPPIKSDPYP